MSAPWKESYDKPRQHIKKQRHHFASKGPYSQSYGFSNSHVWMWETDCNKGWAPKPWCFQLVVLEKSLESPLDCKEVKPVNLKGNQPWIFIEMTHAKAKAAIPWPPDVKSWLIGKDPDAGKDWGQKGKGVAEDEMVGWHHWLNRHEFEQTPGDSEGQEILVCYSPRDHKELDMTQWLNNNKNKNCQPPIPVPPPLSEMAHTRSTECFSPNKPTTYSVLCLPLNSFCNETRIWTSLNPETRCVMSIRGHEFSSKTGFWLGLDHDL